MKSLNLIWGDASQICVLVPWLALVNLLWWGLSLSNVPRGHSAIQRNAEISRIRLPRATWPQTNKRRQLLFIIFGDEKIRRQQFFLFVLFALYCEK